MNWETRLDGRKVATRSSRIAAMNAVDRPWWGGAAEVRNATTGECWERRGSSWFLVYEGRRPTSTKTAGGAA